MLKFAENIQIRNYAQQEVEESSSRCLRQQVFCQGCRSKQTKGRGRGYGDGALLKMQRSKTSRSKKRDDDHDVEHQLHEATQEVF